MGTNRSSRDAVCSVVLARSGQVGGGVGPAVRGRAGALYSAALRITPRRMHWLMRGMMAVPTNRPVRPSPGFRTRLRNAAARVLPCRISLKTRAISTAPALRVEEARAQARVRSGWAARPDTVTAAVLMALVWHRTGGNVNTENEEKFVTNVRCRDGGRFHAGVSLARGGQKKGL